MPARSPLHGLLYTGLDVDAIGSGRLYRIARPTDERCVREKCPVDPVCDCPLRTTLRGGAVAHLFRIGDALAGTLAPLHNLRFYTQRARRLSATPTYPRLPSCTWCGTRRCTPRTTPTWSGWPGRDDQGRRRARRLRLQPGAGRGGRRVRRADRTRGRVRHCDVLVAPEPIAADVGLLLKTYHCIEDRLSGAGLRLVAEVAANRVVVSFPLRATNGGPRCSTRPRHEVSRPADERGWAVRRGRLSTEEFVVVDKERDGTQH